MWTACVTTWPGFRLPNILLSSAQAGFGGAYLFNLAEGHTWGIIRTDADFRLRPAGLAFSLLSGLSGSAVAPVSIAGAGSVTLSAGDGNNPSGLSYPLVSAVAGVAGWQFTPRGAEPRSGQQGKPRYQRARLRPFKSCGNPP